VRQFGGPDYLTTFQDGGFYGWPYSYWGQNVDIRVQPQNPERVAAATRPDYSLGSHVAALGVSFSAPAMGTNSPTAPSWVSMAAGTGNRLPVTRSSSCRSAAASHPVRRSLSLSLTALSVRTARRLAGPWA
jgi:hypothetical protein